jgi:hypothetical protein
MIARDAPRGNYQRISCAATTKTLQFFTALQYIEDRAGLMNE